MKVILIIYVAIGTIIAFIVIPIIIKEDKTTKMFIISIISLIILIFMWPIGVIGSCFDKKRGKQK